MPETSPNPIREPSSPAQPRITMESPSLRNLRSSPSATVTVALPPYVCSSKLPSVPGSDPEMVPEPKRSPGCRLQPVMVWWAIICGHDQRRFLELVLVMVFLLPDAAVHLISTEFLVAVP